MADLSITATSVELVSGSTGTKDAAESITAGQVLYLTSNGEVGVASNDNANKDTVEGLALNGAAAGQPVTYAKTGAEVTIGATLTVGTFYVLSASGAISPIDDMATSDYVALLGYGKTTANLYTQFVNTGLQQA